MALNSREQQKAAFLLACAQAGLSDEETRGLIKAALDGPLDTIRALGTGAMTLGGLGLAGAGVAGAGAGYLGAKLTEPDADPEEAKQQELIDAYKLYADEAIRAAKRRRAYRQPAPTGPRLLR